LQWVVARGNIKRSGRRWFVEPTPVAVARLPGTTKQQGKGDCVDGFLARVSNDWRRGKREYEQTAPAGVTVNRGRPPFQFRDSP